MNPDDFSEEKYDLAICDECRTELVDSTSDRGYKFCPECETTRARRDVIGVCRCCRRNFAPKPPYCANCREYECDPDIPECRYRLETTDVSECSHSLFPLPFQAGSRCIWCGYVDSPAPEAPDSFHDSGGGI